MTANVKVGGSTGMNPRVPDVETLECRPAYGPLPAVCHELVKIQDGPNVLVKCRWCNTPWWMLDEQARA